MTIIYILLGLIYLSGFLIFIICCRRAPFGYEDENGFHLSDSNPAHSAAKPARSQSACL